MKPIARVTLRATTIGLKRAEECNSLADYLQVMADKYLATRDVEVKGSAPFNVAAGIMEVDYVTEETVARVTLKGEPMAKKPRREP